MHEAGCQPQRQATDSIAFLVRGYYARQLICRAQREIAAQQLQQEAAMEQITTETPCTGPNIILCGGVSHFRNYQRRWRQHRIVALMGSLMRMALDGSSSACWAA